MITPETIKNMAKAVNLHPIWTEGLLKGGVFGAQDNGYKGAHLFAKYVQYLKDNNSGKVPDARLESGKTSNDFLDFLNREKEAKKLDATEEKYFDEISPLIKTKIENEHVMNNKEVITFAKVFEDLLVDESGNSQINIIGPKYAECLQKARGYSEVREEEKTDSKPSFQIPKIQKQSTPEAKKQEKVDTSSYGSYSGTSTYTPDSGVAPIPVELPEKLNLSNIANGNILLDQSTKAVVLQTVQSVGTVVYFAVNKENGDLTEMQSSPSNTKNLGSIENYHFKIGDLTIIEEYKTVSGIKKIYESKGEGKKAIDQLISETLRQKQKTLDDEHDRVEELIAVHRGDIKIGEIDSVYVDQDGVLIAKYSLDVNGEKSENLILQVRISPEGEAVSSIINKHNGEMEVLNSGSKEEDAANLWGAVNSGYVPTKTPTVNVGKGTGNVFTGENPGLVQEKLGYQLPKSGEIPQTNLGKFSVEPQHSRAALNLPSEMGSKLAEMNVPNQRKVWNIPRLGERRLSTAPMTNRPNQKINQQEQPVDGKPENPERGKGASRELAKAGAGTGTAPKKGGKFVKRFGVCTGGVCGAFYWLDGGTSSAETFHAVHNTATGIIKTIISFFF